MKLKIDNLSNMTPEQEKQFFDEFERQLDSDTGEAAKAHLAAGRPIYYEDPEYPGDLVKEYPNGKRELVSIDITTRAVTVKREL